MSLIGMLVMLVVVGVVLYLVETALPIDNTIKQIIRIVVVLAVCIALLRYAGLF